VSSRLSACLVYFLGLFVRIEYLTALLGFFLFGPALYSAPPYSLPPCPYPPHFCSNSGFCGRSSVLSNSLQFSCRFCFCSAGFAEETPFLKGKTLTWSKFLSVPKPKIWGFVGQKTQDNGINISMQGKVCG
jgi:hypothetical protein